MNPENRAEQGRGRGGKKAADPELRAKRDERAERAEQAEREEQDEREVGSWREGNGPIEAEDIIRFLSQVVRGRIGGKKPATVTERIRAATVLLKLYQEGEILMGDEEEDDLSAAIRQFREEGT
ncbi:MAG: hypothetical protein E7576_10875 [Ruminococcaceae bacterium]|nr:hypothetical protein [Oscillospiraceae bacterium]